MPHPLIPARRRGIEVLDDPDVDAGLRRRSHRDIQLANRLFGGTRALLSELDDVLPTLPKRASLLDVGTGVGDIPQKASERASAAGVELVAMGLDSVESLVNTSTHRIPLGIVGDALTLPFTEGSIDVVCCSQVLHHFTDDDAITLIGEMTRVARRRVIVSDLRRSWLAVAGLWVSSFPLAFHPVSRHDGVTSILRGFTPEELRALVWEGARVEARIRRHMMFRLTAAWSPRHQ